MLELQSSTKVKCEVWELLKFSSYGQDSLLIYMYICYEKK